MIIENKTSIEIVVRLTVREFSLKRPAFFFALKYMGEIHDDFLQTDEKITG